MPARQLVRLARPFSAGECAGGLDGRCLDGCLAEPTCPYSAPRFGRCVYRCDNNVVDHQVVNMEFAGGVTATFSMCGFTHNNTRQIQVMGTRGEIRSNLDGDRLTVYDFTTKEEREIRLYIPDDELGHSGADEALMRQFLADVRGFGGEAHSLTSPSASLQGYLMAFAAEQFRLQGGASVSLREYAAEVARNGLREGTDD